MRGSAEEGPAGVGEEGVGPRGELSVLAPKNPFPLQAPEVPLPGLQALRGTGPDPDPDLVAEGSSFRDPCTARRRNFLRIPETPEKVSFLNELAKKTF
jgi:hypothetical protein